MNTEKNTAGKHWKKFLRSEYTTETAKPPEPETDMGRSPDMQELLVHIKEEPPSEAPPLPLDPPPDADYGGVGDLSLLASYNAPPLPPDTVDPLGSSVAKQMTPPVNKPGQQCKDFVRGKCNRGERCRYEHVHRFCHIYQNSKDRRCTRRECNYVHGTIFEEAEYKRSGYLPPHTTAHLRRPPMGPVPATAPAPSSAPVPAPYMIPPPAAPKLRLTPPPPPPPIEEMKMVADRECPDCVDSHNRLNFLEAELELNMKSLQEIREELAALEEKEGRLDYTCSIILDSSLDKRSETRKW